MAMHTSRTIPFPPRSALATVFLGAVCLSLGGAGSNPGGLPGTYCVLDYGAKGDGTTDDTAAITAAIAAAPNTGAILYFPPGRYAVSTIAVNKPLRILGAGAQASVLIANHPTADTMVVDVGKNEFQAVHISDIGFKSDIAKTGGAFVNFKMASDESCLDHFEMNGGFVGVRMATGASLYVQNGQIENSGIYVPGGGKGSAGIIVANDQGTIDNDHYIRNVTMNNYPNAEHPNLPSAGIWVQYAGSLNITDCDIINCHNDLLITGGSGIYALNSFFDTAENGIYITADPTRPEARSVVNRCHFIGCWTSSHSQRGVYIDASDRLEVDGIDFIGHHAYFNGTNTAADGMYLGKGENIKVVDGTFSNNGGSGISVGPGVRHYRLSGNRCGVTRSGVPAVSRQTGNAYGIFVTGADYGFITENDLSGNVMGPLGIKDQGARTVVRDNFP